ncbi:hypothetical protein F5B19DRAFT_458442 [Rostrohypoxylon terebratum]|nr:hypothetical protein F5B19DRAFT_458442 [Rostrohypoxylon terebratum]
MSDDSSPLAKRAPQEPATLPPQDAHYFDAFQPEGNHFRRVFTSKFADFEDHGFATIPAYFLNEYEGLIELQNRQVATISLIQPSGHRGIGRWNYCLETMELYENWMRENISQFKGQPAVHGSLLRIVGNLARQPWLHWYDNTRFRRHIRAMTENIVEIDPPREFVWSAGDIIHRPEFEQAFEQFNNLKAERMKDDEQIRWFVFQSLRILKKAFESINLPYAIYSLPNVYCWEDELPTYLNYPWNSNKGRFGEGTRPGIVQLKELLGGPLSVEEKRGLRRARESPKKRAREDDPQTPTRPPKIPKIPKTPKTPRVILAGNYSMTMKNVDADLGNIYEEGNLPVVGLRYSHLDIVTGTVPNNRSTLRSLALNSDTGNNAATWGISQLLSRLRVWTCLPEKPPRGQSTWDKVISETRDYIAEHRKLLETKVDPDQSTRSLSEGRVRAYGLKFLRTLLIKLLLMSQPPVSSDVLHEAFAARLEDWILFERVWNAGDTRHLRHLENSGRADSLRADALKSIIGRREENITFLGGMLRRVRGDVGGTTVEPWSSEPSSSDRTSESPEGLKIIRSAIGNPENNGRGINFTIRDVIIQMDENFLQNLHHNPGTVKNQLNLPDGILYQMQPKHPRVGVHFNEREEREHLELRRAIALDGLFGARHSGFRGRQLREHFSEERLRLSDILEKFEQGGPPDYGSIPKNTVFERLTYMVIMTLWRTFTAKDLIMEGTIYKIK